MRCSDTGNNTIFDSLEAQDPSLASPIRAEAIPPQVIFASCLPSSSLSPDKYYNHFCHRTAISSKKGECFSPLAENFMRLLKEQKSMICECIGLDPHDDGQAKTVTAGRAPGLGASENQSSSPQRRLSVDREMGVCVCEINGWRKQFHG